MEKDLLFLLAPGFEDEGRPWFCTACAAMEGFLGYFPQVREALDVVYYPFPRPRQAIIDLVGEANQGMPVLLLGAPSDHPDVKRAPGGAYFISDERPICRYLAAKHGVAAPHP